MTTNLPPDLTPPPGVLVTTWRIQVRPHGLKRWQITRCDRGPGYTGVTAWRFAEQYQAERYAVDVLGVPREAIDPQLEMTR